MWISTPRCVGHARIPARPGDSSTVQATPPSASSATMVTAVEADIVAAAASVERGRRRRRPRPAPAGTARAPARRPACRSSRWPRMFSSTPTPEALTPILPTMPASVSVSTRRPSACSIVHTSQPSRSSSCQSHVCTPSGLARRGGGAEAGDRRALPGGRGQKLGAGVQRADQLDVEAAAVGDAVDLLEQGRRPRRDPVERLGAEPAQLVARKAHAYGEQAPVDVHHKGDALLLSTSERDAAGSWSALRRVVSSDIHVVRSIIAGGTCPKGDVSKRVSSPGHARDRGSRRGRHVHRRRPDRRGEAGDGQGRDHRGRPLGRRDRGRAPRAARRGPRRGRRDPLRPRHHGRHQRHARAPRRPHGLRRHARVRATSRRSAARPAPISTGPRWRRPRRWPRSQPRSTSGWGQAACSAPLQPASVAAAARRLRRERVEAIAVCLLHAYADPSHEQAVAAALRSALPDVHVVASHEVAAEFREFERASTTIADAYLGPVAGRYLRRLAGTATGRGPARSGGHAVERRRVRRRRGGGAPRPAAPVRAGRRRRGRGGGGHPGRDQLRHGRDVDRRLPDPRRGRRAQRRAAGRRPAAAAAAARHPHGRRGRGQHRLARPGRRAAGGAARAPGPIPARPATAVAASSPRSPTRTSCSAGSTRMCRSPAGCAWTRAAADRALRAVAGPFADVRAAAEGVVAVANAEMVRAIGVVSVEQGHDPARARAGGIRRRRAAARLRGGRQPRHARGGGAGRRRRALGARDRRRRAPPGHGRKRDAAAARSSWTRSPPRRGRRGAARSRSSASCAIAARRTS